MEMEMERETERGRERKGERFCALESEKEEK